MKLNKCISLFLAFFILVSNIGLAVNVHYCGDEIATISLNTKFNSPASEENCCGEMEQKSHCCKDKVVHLQKKSDQLLVNAFAFETNIFFVLPSQKPIIYSPVIGFKTNQTDDYYCDAHAPPLFKLYSQYLLYA